jgi:hypothetical protein
MANATATGVLIDMILMVISPAGCEDRHRYPTQFLAVPLEESTRITVPATSVPW